MTTVEDFLRVDADSSVRRTSPALRTARILEGEHELIQVELSLVLAERRLDDLRSRA